MADRGGFSLASMILSYFLVAGGIAIGLILIVLMKMSGEVPFYLGVAVGGAIGGFAAARASRGSTITEPAIGGGLVVLTMVGVFVGTDVGSIMWKVASSEISKVVMISGVAAAGGAIGGAAFGEKMFHGHSESPGVWLIHVTLAVLGASVVALMVVMAMMVRGEHSDTAAGGAYFGAVAAGALLSGIAVGVSAPRRLLLVSLVGTVAGTFGFYLLMTAIPGVKNDSDAAIGFVIIGIAFGLLTMLGDFIGWKVHGQKQASGSAAAVFE